MSPKLNTQHRKFTITNDSLISERHKSLSKSYSLNNEQIKNKIAEYNSSRKFLTNSLTPKDNINGKKIYERLRRQGIQLKDLLTREAPTQDIDPYNEQTIMIIPTTKFNGRINCKGQSSPLALRVSIAKVVPSLFLYFSLTFENPTRIRNEKKVKLNGRKQVAVFHETMNGLKFTNDYIYIGLEASEECSFNILCYFGKSKSSNNVFIEGLERAKHEVYSVTRSDKVIKKTNIINIESMIKEIKLSPEKIRECNIIARQIREKRKLKALKLSNKNSLLKLNRTSYPTGYNRFKRVSEVRMKIEQEDFTRKFFFTNKRKIFNRYVKLFYMSFRVN